MLRGRINGVCMGGTETLKREPSNLWFSLMHVQLPPSPGGQMGMGLVHLGSASDCVSGPGTGNGGK